MHATKSRSLRMSRSIVLFVLSVAALALTFTPLGSAHVTDSGGSADGAGSYGFFSSTLALLGVTGDPEEATGLVESNELGADFTGVAECIAIDETPTGFRASIAGEIIAGLHFQGGARGFRLTVYDNTPSGQTDRVSDVEIRDAAQTTCTFDFPGSNAVTGDFTVVAGGACPPNGDEDKDGLTDSRESLFSTLLGNSDSDLDGINDGNDDANGNGDDDEDEDDGEDDGCPDEDSDDDGEDDEDEDDDD